MRKLLWLCMVVLLLGIVGYSCKKSNTDTALTATYPAYLNITETNFVVTANNMVRNTKGNFVIMSNLKTAIGEKWSISIKELEVNGDGNEPFKRSLLQNMPSRNLTGNNFVFDEKNNVYITVNSSYDNSLALSFTDIMAVNLTFNPFFTQTTSVLKVDVRRVILLSDGFLVVGGKTLVNNNRNVFIQKYDNNLNAKWEKTYGGVADDMGIDAVQLCDGNIGILAHTYSYGVGDRDVWFLKVNQRGDSLSSHFFGGAGYEEPQQIVADERCRYYIAAHSSSFGHPEHNGYIVCVDDNGNKIWENNYGTVNHDGFNAIALLPDKKGVIAAGRSMNGFGGQEDIFVQAVNFEGVPLWSKIYGHATKSENGVAIITDDKFYYLLLNRTLGIQNEAVFVVDKLE